MDGPAHYRRAQELLAEIEANPVFSSETAMIIGQALVHATLADADATALGSSREWTDVARTRLSNII